MASFSHILSAQFNRLKRCSTSWPWCKQLEKKRGKILVSILYGCSYCIFNLTACLSIQANLTRVMMLRVTN